jgi:hypothetical protein
MTRGKQGRGTPLRTNGPTKRIRKSFLDNHTLKVDTGRNSAKGL